MESTVESLVRPCKTISADKTVRDFIRQLDRQQDWFCLVMDNGRVAGIVDEKDLLRLLKLSPLPGMEAIILGEVVRKDLDTPITDIMTTTLLTVRGTATVKEALELMVSRGLSYLIVIDGGQPSGFVRLSDVVAKAVGGI